MAKSSENTIGGKKLSKIDKAGLSNRRGNREKKSSKVFHKMNTADNNTINDDNDNNKNRSTKFKMDPFYAMTPFKVALIRAKRLKSRPVEANQNVELLDNVEKKQLAKWGFIVSNILEIGRASSKYRVFYVEEPPEGGVLRRKFNLWCKVVETSNKAAIEDLKSREISMLTRLHHPNVISFHSVLLFKTKIFLFSSGSSNGTVLHFLSTYGPIFENHGRIWFRQILNGLEYLYSRRINHNDINCETLWIGSNYEIIIGDLSRATYQEKGLSSYRSESLYSAPEVLSGEPHNPKMADMWSLGVVLYSFFTGQPPFPHYGVKSGQILELIRDQKAMLWSGGRSGIKISRHSWKIIASLLEPDVLKRANLLRLKETSFYKMLECVCGHGSFKSLCLEILGNLPRLYTMPSDRSSSSKINNDVNNKSASSSNDNNNNNNGKIDKTICPVLKEFWNQKKEVSFKIEDAEKIPTVLTISDDSSPYFS